MLILICWYIFISCLCCLSGTSCQSAVIHSDDCVCHCHFKLKIRKKPAGGAIQRSPGLLAGLTGKEREGRDRNGRREGKREEGK